MGNVGEAILFAMMFLLGTLSLVVLLASAQIRTWPANYYFPELYFIESSCMVLEARLDKSLRPTEHYRPELLIEMRDDADVREVLVSLSSFQSSREAQLAILNRYQVGASYACWYDAVAPEIVKLRKPSLFRFWLVLVALIALILIGGGRVVYTVVDVGTSPERRAAIANRATRLDLIREAAQSSSDYPSVPGDANMKNSPGIKLAYRLPIVRSPVLRVLAAGLFCLVWSSIALVFLAVVVNSFLRGRPEWALGLVTIVFLPIGVWSVIYFVRQLVFVAGIGPTGIEISDHPLYPGRSYRVILTQAGRFSVDRLGMVLVCEEEATYRQGTDVRTEIRRVHEQQVFQCENVTMRFGWPFEYECELEIPQHAMHSFRASSNSVQWKLVVEGEVAKWPFQRNFPVVVFSVAHSRVGA